jgi:arylsulfatase A-like enzyme
MPERSARPNIIVLYADDLGFGDVGCYGARHIPTPGIDRLGREGIRFTQGYAAAATCTPSRYSLLTGAFPRRNPDARVLPGDAPMIIPAGTPTMPAMLKEAGYATGVVGKWHLGLGRGEIDWNGEIAATPLDIGFDESFILPATNDRVPCIYIDGRRVGGLDPHDPIAVSFREPIPGVPMARHHPELLRMHHSDGHDMSIVNGVGRIGWMKGGAAALWKDETMADVFLDRAKTFVTDHRNEPFFLYYAFHQPHVPRLPGPRFEGVTPHGPRGDVIAEMDWCVGELLDTLDELGLAGNTIVIFSSDNGPVLDDGYHDRAAELLGDHSPAGPLRGGKYSLFDGGTRVPFLLRWPDRVAAGESPALVNHLDFYASFAALTGTPLERDAAPDSLNVLPALLGDRTEGRSEHVVVNGGHQSVLRQGDLVYIPPHPGVAFKASTATETGCSGEPQLYDLADDIGQIRNLAERERDVVTRMAKRLRTIEAAERMR